MYARDYATRSYSVHVDEIVRKVTTRMIRVQDEEVAGGTGTSKTGQAVETHFLNRRSKTKYFQFFQRTWKFVNRTPHLPRRSTTSTAENVLHSAVIELFYVAADYGRVKEHYIIF